MAKRRGGACVAWFSCSFSDGVPALSSSFPSGADVAESGGGIAAGDAVSAEALHADGSASRRGKRHVLCKTHTHTVFYNFCC